MQDDVGDGLAYRQEHRLDRLFCGPGGRRELAHRFAGAAD
jgi:hypothetical protein